MGLKSKLNKMKSFLFDDEEEKEPTKKLSQKGLMKEEKSTVKEEEKKLQKEVDELYFEDVSEPELSEENDIGSRTSKNSDFNFPELTDDDFMVTTKEPEPIVVPEVKEEPKRVLYQGSKRKEETKKFKPSPIISPIYGLLDSSGNMVSEGKTEESKYNEDVSFDEVRKKAYGNLDEEIENTMKRLSKKTIEEAENDMEEEEKLSRTSKKKKKEEKIVVTGLDEDDDDDDDMILPNVNFKEIDVDKEKERSKRQKKAAPQTEDDDDDDDTKEQDLFNLIDTMYQNKEDED